MSRSARAERNYRNYVRKQGLARDQLRAKMRQSQSAIPQPPEPQQPAETTVTTENP